MDERDFSQNKNIVFTLTLISYSWSHFCLYLEMAEYQQTFQTKNKKEKKIITIRHNLKCIINWLRKNDTNNT